MATPALIVSFLGAPSIAVLAMVSRIFSATARAWDLGFYESQLREFLEGEEKQRYVTEFRQALARKARAKARLDWQRHQRKNGECA